MASVIQIEKPEEVKQFTELHKNGIYPVVVIDKNQLEDIVEVLLEKWHKENRVAPVNYQASEVIASGLTEMLTDLLESLPERIMQPNGDPYLRDMLCKLHDCDMI